jgi:tetratricopeptide (TPR) repeat protein
MRRLIFLVAACLCLVVPGAGQSQNGERDANQNQPPPRSDRNKEAGESSSRDNQIDLSPPSNDAKEHPNSALPRDDSDDNSSGDVQEFHFSMAPSLEKLARLDEAAECYQEYLKILPNGPQAEEAKKALEKIKANAPPEKDQAKQ